jgi:hypothetical protein
MTAAANPRAEPAAEEPPPFDVDTRRAAGAAASSWPAEVVLDASADVPVGSAVAALVGLDGSAVAPLVVGPTDDDERLVAGRAVVGALGTAVVAGGAVVGGGSEAAQIEAKERNGGAAPLPHFHPSTSPSRTVVAPAPTCE